VIPNLVIGCLDEVTIVEQPLLDRLGGLWVDRQVEFLGIAVRVFDEDAGDAIEVPVAVPTTGQINLADEVMDSAAQFDAGFVFEVNAEVVISKHFDLHCDIDVTL